MASKHCILIALGFAVTVPVLAGPPTFGTEGRVGFLVQAVEPDSPAAAAGVRSGDLLYQINDQSVGSLAGGRGVVEMIAAHGGEVVTVLLLRPNGSGSFMDVRGQIDTSRHPEFKTGLAGHVVFLVEQVPETSEGMTAGVEVGDYVWEESSSARIVVSRINSKYGEEGEPFHKVLILRRQ